MLPESVPCGGTSPCQSHELTDLALSPVGPDWAIFVAIATWIPAISLVSPARREGENNQVG